MTQDQKNIDNLLEISGESTPESAARQGSSARFEVLQGYARTLVVLGWIVTAGGFISGLAGLDKFDRYGFLAVLPGLAAIVIGIGTVAAGQLISCIVAIEGNTRNSYELLKTMASVRTDPATPKGTHASLGATPLPGP